MLFTKKSPLVFLGVFVFAGIQAVGVGQHPDPPPAGQNLVGLPPYPDPSSKPAEFAPPVQGDSGSKVGAAGEMIGFSHSDGTGTQTITLVNTSKSWMAVYHIDRSGKIRLASSRPIDADFTLQLNATAPLPSEIRQMEVRRDRR
jgi:hypothetical protein